MLSLDLIPLITNVLIHLALDCLRKKSNAIFIILLPKFRKLWISIIYALDKVLSLSSTAFFIPKLKAHFFICVTIFMKYLKKSSSMYLFFLIG